MNHPADRKTLLAEVFADETPVEFRAAMLGETLRLARRRRRFRQTRHAAVSLAMLAGMAALAWKNLAPAPVHRVSDGSTLRVVCSQPLPEAALVTSQPLAPDSIVVSTASAVLVSTERNGSQFQVIDDSQLLSLAGPGAAALVRWAPHDVELVFAHANTGDGPPPD
jgi:hypothetical protein